MTISVIGSTTFVNASNASGNISINVPAGVQDGDILLLFSVEYAGLIENRSTPSGWTLLDARDIRVSYGSSAIYWRVAASEPASYTIKVGSTDKNNVAAMVAVRGVDNTAPIDAWGVTNDSKTHPSVTTTVDNALVWRFACGVTYARTFTWPAGQTEQWDGTYPGGGGASNAYSSGAYAAQETAGASGTVEVTPSEPYYYYAMAYTVALAPGVPPSSGQPTMARWAGVPGMTPGRAIHGGGRGW